MKFDYSYFISRSSISWKSIGRRICPLSTKTASSSLSSNYRKKLLDAARLLIAEGKLSAAQISELLNYSTAYAFSKAFKQEYGVSPAIIHSRKLDTRFCRILKNIA